MIVERLTYAQAVNRVDDAAQAVEDLEYKLALARRSLRIATAGDAPRPVRAADRTTAVTPDFVMGKW